MNTPAESVFPLRRSLGLGHATAVVVGIIIGASIFVQPSVITGQMRTPGGVLAVWATAGLLTMIGALVIAELSSAFTRGAGVYTYLTEAYSPALGFLWGWAMFWTMHSGIVAAIAVICARYVGTFVPLGDAGTRAVAVAAIVVLSTVNYRGLRQGSAVQTALTIMKVLAIVLIVALAFTIGNAVAGAAPGLAATSAAAPASSTAAAVAPVASDTRAFVVALIAGLFAFGGWHMVSYTADETINPARTIPRALAIGTLTVTALYVALNAAYLHVLPLEKVSASTRVAADFADAVLGGRGGELMSALVILSTLGALNGVILTGPRVYRTMSADGLLFNWVGAVHPAFGTPHRAIVLQGVWSSLLVLTGSYRVLFTRVVYTEWIFFALIAASLVLLRRRTDYAPAFRMWGYPMLPALFVVASVGIVVNQVVNEPVESMTGLLLVASGLPVYFLWARKRTSISHSSRNQSSSNQSSTSNTRSAGT